MFFRCEREPFLQAIQAAQRAVSSRTTLPILSGLLLNLEDGTLTVTGTDLDLGIETQFGVEQKEPGAMVLDARALADIVRRLPDRQVELSLDAATHLARITSGPAHFEIHSLDAADFPALPDPGEGLQWSVSYPVLRQLIRFTTFAAANDDTRASLNGALLELEDGEAHMVATDSYRLALFVQPQGAATSVKALIPAQTLQEVAKLLVDVPEAQAQITLGKSHALFQLGSTRVVTRLIDATFPNYRQIIPASFVTETVVDRLALQSALERASLLSRGGAVIVKMEISADQLQISASVPDEGDYREALPAQSTGEDLEVAFNARYLLDALRVIPNAAVRLRCTGSRSASLLMPEGPLAGGPATATSPTPDAARQQGDAPAAPEESGGASAESASGGRFVYMVMPVMYR